MNFLLESEVALSTLRDFSTMLLLTQLEESEQATARKLKRMRTQPSKVTASSYKQRGNVVVLMVNLQSQADLLE